MAEEPQFGAFTEILDIDSNQNKVNENEPIDDFTYGVYQLLTQKPEIDDATLQKTYGTEVLPIYQWAKTIQTGERTFDPNDFEDQQKLEQYRQLETPPGFLTPEEIQRQLISDTTTAVASRIGGEIGQAIGEGVDSPVTSGLKSAFGFGDLPGDVIINPELDLSAESFTKLNDANKLLAKTKEGGEFLFNSAIANEQSAIASGNLPEYKLLKQQSDFINIGTKDSPLLAFRGDGNKLEVNDEIKDVFGRTRVTKRDVNIEGNNPQTGKPYETYSAKTLPEAKTGMKGYWERVKSDATSKSTMYASAGSGITAFFTDLLLTKGEDPVKSAKKGAGTAAGTYIGSVLGGPVGAVVGATVGASIGGRVICNELRRLGLMTTEDILIDYFYTHKYLTPIHVKGYHVWAINVVKSMRKGKNVKFWHHIANHRLNHVKYLLGKRDKPDYLGKLYKIIGESICFGLGLFCKKTDWSILYNKKEI
jgi:hypothetical protein|tara:strand:+ start:22 stop:1452 length:1431 start_codon:yes stop_codon:yes gene_type:complete